MEIKKMFIDGEWVLSSSGEVREVINPADEEVIAKVTEGTADDVKKAVAAAKRAFYEDGWMESVATDRADYLLKIAAKIEENAELFINFILRPEINKEIVESYPYTSVNKAAKDMLPDTYTNSKASNIPTDEMDKGEFVKDLGDATAKYDKIWSEIKK